MTVRTGGCHDGWRVAAEIAVTPHSILNSLARFPTPLGPRYGCRHGRLYDTLSPLLPRSAGERAIGVVFYFRNGATCHCNQRQTPEI